MWDSCSASPIRCSSSTRDGCEPQARARPRIPCTGRSARRLRRLRTERTAQAAARRRQRPFSRDAYLGQTIENGVRLAASEVNASGIRIDGTSYDLKVQTMDSALSPARAVANVRRAVERARDRRRRRGHRHRRVLASAPRGTPDRHRLPRRHRLVDPATRPNVFRIAPTDHGIAFRLAEYLIPKGLKVGLLHDDSGYGPRGARGPRRRRSRRTDLGRARGDGAGERDSISRRRCCGRVARTRRRCSSGQPATIAAAIIAARSRGLERPVVHAAGRRRPVRPPAAGRPSVLGRRAHVRRRPDDRRGRPGAVHTRSSSKYETAYGVDQRRREDARRARGDPAAGDGDVRLRLRQPARSGGPAKAGSTDPPKIAAALEEVTIEGANGDERGVQPGQPRRRRRRRRIFRPLPGHDLRAR